MNLEFLANPLVAYGIAAAGLLVSLVLFANIRWEIAKAGQRSALQAKELHTARETDRQAISALEAEIESLREAVGQLERIPAGRGSGASINLAKRAQALRMYRRGEPLTSIAAALETSGNEIALLLKIHAMTSEGNEKVS